MLLILLICLSKGTALQKDVELKTTAYDCGIKRHNDVDISTYSLMDTGNCEVNAKHVNVTEILGQIVEKQKIKNIMVSQCKIVLHRTVQRCSLFGYLEPVDNGIQEYQLEISRSQCEKLHESGIFMYDSTRVISDVKVNATTTRSIYLAGDAIDNSCNTGSFSDRFGSYSRVIVQGLFAITLTSYLAKLDTENKVIHLTSGLACDFDKMYCVDSMNGYTFWERITRENCMTEKLTLIYHGKITKVNEKN